MKLNNEIDWGELMMKKEVTHWFHIPSKEKPGDTHDVFLFSDGSAYCDCQNTFYQINKLLKDNCDHKRKAWEAIKTGEFEINNKDDRQKTKQFNT